MSRDGVPKEPTESLRRLLSRNVPRRSPKGADGVTPSTPFPKCPATESQRSRRNHSVDSFPEMSRDGVPKEPTESLRRLLSRNVPRRSPKGADGVAPSTPFPKCPATESQRSRRSHSVDSFPEMSRDGVPKELTESLRRLLSRNVPRRSPKGADGVAPSTPLPKCPATESQRSRRSRSVDSFPEMSRDGGTEELTGSVRLPICGQRRSS